MDKTIYGETIYISEPFYGWNFDIFHSDEIGKILYGQYKILKLCFRHYIPPPFFKKFLVFSLKSEKIPSSRRHRLDSI